jgi:hypothetical protein
MHWRFVFAYVDPGTGSYLFQLAIAGLLGAGYVVKHLWCQVRDRAKRLFVRAQRYDDR